MSYVLVESRDPFGSADGGRLYEFAAALAEEADDVTVFLVENGVLAARRESAAAGALTALGSKAAVLADTFSLRQRAIEADELAPGVGTADIDELVDLVVEDGRKTLWC